MAKYLIAFIAVLFFAQSALADITSPTIKVRSGTLNTVEEVESITAITSITDMVNLQSVDLVDEITLVDSVTLIDAITELANITSLDLVDAITEVANVASVDTVDTVTAVTDITNTIDVYLVDPTTGDGVELDDSTNSLQTIDYEHHEIHSGSHYFVVGYQDLSINQVLDFTWQMPDTTKEIHWTWEISTESETLWQVYETAVVTNALANTVVPRNSNRNSLNTSDTTMKFELQANLVAADADTDVTTATLIESGISGAGKDAGDDLRSNEVIMKRNTLYCLRATASAAGYINFKMQWYEHVPKN